MSTRRLPRARSNAVRPTIKRRASRRKTKQLPHILKHFTFIVVLLAIALITLSGIIHSSALTVDAIILCVFCAIVDGLALAL
jgi:hypothetical protein